MHTKTKELYYCDHCDRMMLAKSPMTKHEKDCAHNPTNKHKCFSGDYSCKNLETIEVEVQFEYYGEPRTTTVKKYRCAAHDK